MPTKGYEKLLERPVGKEENLDKIRKMSLFEDNWNGAGAKAFSEKAIKRFVSVVESLDVQPEIAPTGRNSLYMEYRKKDGSLLSFEIKEDGAEKVYVERGDYGHPDVEWLEDEEGESLEHMLSRLIEKFFWER